MHRSKHYRESNLYTRRGLLGLFKKKGELWARPPVLTPVPVQANHSSPPIAVDSRRVRLPRNLQNCFDSLDRLPFLRNWLAFMLDSWSALRNSNCGTIKKLFLSGTVWEPGSLGLVVRTWRTWRHKRGPDTRDNRHVRQQRETLSDAGGNVLVALTRSSAVHQAQCDAPLQVGHWRFGCRSRRHVDQLRFIGIGMRWSGVFFFFGDDST